MHVYDMLHACMKNNLHLLCVYLATFSVLLYNIIAMHKYMTIM